jgi:hypothetical protein
MIKIMTIILCAGITVSLVPALFGVRAEALPGGDIEAILKLHEELIAAHKAYDVNRLLEAEPDTILTVKSGEVFYQTKRERIPMFKEYLDITEFEEYRDLIDPIVRVSDDGTMGWLIAQVKIKGTHTGGDGELTHFDTVWAWIELFEKRDGRWIRIGDVSSVKQVGE